MITKIILTLAFPFIIIWDVSSRIWYEIENIPRFVWSDICQEWQHYINAMRE